jgi:hypothetical protein
MKNNNKVTEAVIGPASLKATRRTKIREGPISDMEKLLMAWIEYPSQHHDDHDQSKIFFAMLKGKAGSDYDVEFTASSGWFKRFNDRYSVHNV